MRQDSRDIKAVTKTSFDVRKIEPVLKRLFEHMSKTTPKTVTRMESSTAWTTHRYTKQDLSCVTWTGCLNPNSGTDSLSATGLKRRKCLGRGSELQVRTTAGSRFRMEKSVVQGNVFILKLS